METYTTTAAIVANLSPVNLTDITPESTQIIPYSFSVPHDSFDKILRKELSLPSVIRDIPVLGHGHTLSKDRVTLQFYLGSAGTGSPMHYHGHAINSLAYGEKKWFLKPPSQAYHSANPVAKFILFDVKASEGLACTQRGGDMMYVPTMWSHAVFNTKQSIGVTFEFPQGIFCSE